LQIADQNKQSVPILRFCAPAFLSFELVTLSRKLNVDVARSPSVVLQPIKWLSTKPSFDFPIYAKLSYGAYLQKSMCFLFTSTKQATLLFN
jgi:hypothetical protein